MNNGQKRNKYDSNYNSFAVKYCTYCKYAWENEHGTEIMYYDFPKYKLQKKTCKKCKKKGYTDA